jgi:formylglycine-generating enzyme required for sulfatase activity
MPRTKVFLSHAGADMEAARRLADCLTQHGLDVWLDGKNLGHRSSWLAQIEAALESCDAFLVYVTQHGVKNWVDAEVRAALVLNRRKPSFRLIPLLGPGHDKLTLPLFLHSETSWIELAADLDAQAGAILEALQRGGDGEPIAVLAEGESPYPGLRTFRTADAHKFFGRDHDTERLLEQMRRNRLLTVIGSSGSGKSSLLRAGLVPALHRGRFSDPREAIENWRVTVFKPGNDPLHELAKAVVELNAPAAQDERERLINAVRTSFGERQALARAIRNRVPESCRVLVIADQFEEVFRSDAPAADCRCLVEALLAAAPADTGPIHVLLHLRADFFPACSRYPELARRVTENLFWCQGMQEEQLRTSIESPLLLAGWSAGPLTDVLLRAVAGEAGNLALLAFTLEHLWRERAATDQRQGASPTLPVDVYNSLGGIEEALPRRAEQIHRDLVGDRESDAGLVRGLFLELAQREAPGQPITRRRIAHADLLGRFADADRPRAAQLLNALVDARLLVTESDPAQPDRPTVDVVHEVLLRRWQRIGEWLDEDHDRRQAETALCRAAGEWQQHRGAPDETAYLWRAARVETTLATAAFDRVPDEVAEFADACRSDEERQAAHDRAMREQIDMLARLQDIERAEREQDDLYPAWPEVAQRMQRWLDERAAPIVALQPQLEQTLAPPAAAEERDQFVRASLQAGLTKLEAFARQTVASVRTRLAWAQRIAELSIDRHRARWNAARASISAADGKRASQLYRAQPIDLAPQIGLVPIGMNPRTKLWEFYELRSAWNGESDPAELPIPSHRSDGDLEVGPETGIVFVLIPGGTFMMGAQSSDEHQPNYDVEAQPHEGPVHEVTLAPFLLARHAMTQAQWARLSGDDDRPSLYDSKNSARSCRRTDMDMANMVTEAHPVEQVSWVACDALLRRHGLVLPTEAQWEYAARAGTTTPWWTGAEKETLRGAANLADVGAEEVATQREIEEWLDDGYTIHAPVDALQPNPFGLHHVHGNIQEWCRDAYEGNYEQQPRLGDGLRHEHGRQRVGRGGSFADKASVARSSNRSYDAEKFSYCSVGLRPGRGITTA